MGSAISAGSALLEALKRDETLLSAELRPPRMNISGWQSMDAWIDTYHTIRRMTVAGRHVFLTDNAVGRPEEENLRHLIANLGPDAERSRIVPMLTAKHSLDYCLRYAERAFEQGFRTLVVLGGDRHDGIPRCVEHAYQLRGLIRARVPGLGLGGWANPNGKAAEQALYLAQGEYAADFYLTQVVSHHCADRVARFLEEIRRRSINLPGIFGVFYYRSGRSSTLESLQQFFPVPAAQLRKEFEEEKLHPDEICARSIRQLWKLGIRHLYVSNLPLADAPARLPEIARLAAEGNR